MTHELKLWLDDERPAPAGWTLAKTAADAIDLLRSGDVSEVSPDHDLGDDIAGTGYDVLNWLEREVVERGFRAPIMHVHTANPPARMRMLAAVAAISRLAAKT